MPDATAPRRRLRRRPDVLDARTGLDKLAGYPYQILDLGRRRRLPGQRRRRGRRSTRTGRTATFDAPAGLEVPTGPRVSLTGSHIRPQPGYGYDERRHVTVWGRRDPDRRQAHPHRRAAPGAGTRRRSRSSSTPSARSASRAATSTPSRRSAARRSSRSCRSAGLTLRTTRLPFLTATIIPVVLGIAIAASHG